MRLELGGEIDEKCKVTIYQAAKLKEWIEKYKGQQVTISFKLKGKKRSNNQNSFYWGVVVDMIMKRLNDLGHDLTPEETHDFLKGRFNFKEIEAVADHFIEVPRSTSRLDTLEFIEYIEKIQVWASTFLGLYIPEPNEQSEISFH